MLRKRLQEDPRSSRRQTQRGGPTGRRRAGAGDKRGGGVHDGRTGQFLPHKPNGSATLVSMFRRLLTGWEKKLTVHTVGFSQSHDFAFLNDLRKVGTSEGVFNYADPGDDSDTLCGKLSHLADSVIACTSLVARVTSPYPVRPGNSSVLPLLPTPTSGASTSTTAAPDPRFNFNLQFAMQDGRGSATFFVDLDKTVAQSITLTTSGVSQDCFLHVNASSPDADSEVFARWIGHLVAEFVQEAMVLASCADQRSTGFKLHCAFLLQRARWLELHVQRDESMRSRLRVSAEQVESLLLGKRADVARLGDIVGGATIAAAPPPKPAAYAPVAPAIPKPSTKKSSRVRILRKRAGLSELHRAVISSSVTLLQARLLADRADFAAVDSQGDTPLHTAACIGRVNAVRPLIDAIGAHIVNTLNTAGFTPLELAIRSGHWKTIDVLLSLGAQLSPTCHASSLLDHSISSGHFNTAGRLIASGLATINMDLLRGRVPPATVEWIMQKQAELSLGGAAASASSAPAATPEEVRAQANVFLQKAVENGMVGLVRTLLQAGQCTPTADHLVLCGALPAAASVQIATMLLDHGVHPDGVPPGHAPASGTTEAVETPLFRAAEKGWTHLCELLLQRGANPNTRNAKGNTPLWIACANKRADCIAALLNAGADPNIPNLKGDVPLVAAVQKNMCAGVAMLLASGANIHQPSDDVNTPVMVCCRMGHSVILNTLLTRCARVEGGVQRELNQFANIDGFNPLLGATEQNHTECINVLLTFGADIHARTSPTNPIVAGATALHLAAYYGRVEAAMLLLEQHADANARDVDGRTPLHIAVRQNNPMIVRLLKQFKADVLARDRFDRVPMYYCSERDAAIRQELEDPALRLLLQGARDFRDRSCIDVMRTCSGIPGCLSTRQCVDLASGDGWTPLMEAVVQKNMEFARTLIELGADPHATDLRGLSAAFWVRILGLSLPGFELNDAEATAVARVEAARRGDVRNGLILDIDSSATSSPLETETLQSREDFDARMSDGVACVAANSVPPSSSACTVLSFLEELPARFYPKGREALARLIFQARLFTIAKIASGTLGPMSVQNAFALYVFASDSHIFLSVNNALRTGTDSRVWTPFIQLVRQALDLLPPFTGEMFRGVTAAFSKDLYAVGKTISWGAFSSGSENWKSMVHNMEALAAPLASNVRVSNYGVIFLVKTRTARRISDFSRTPQDAEVVVLPNTTFRVVNWFIADIIGLGQANIRATSFKSTDADLAKAAKQNECVVVELEEVGESA
eukprot:gnl/Spiro4/16908_TR9117_c0_g1_i1.p1 gnl/Spiro4/16908_TR9117_c0_g1~~gnl/Spiro4/16908_TR9117_c0_g1_i1.p1  ORF type:complete len:1272 (-),score=436.55 gnl/Spiro4/16908_TR9117_c0_g1_i1:98-3913(-)